MIKLLIFSGSARRESVNQKLARTATALAQETEAEVEFLNVADYPMPLFDQDLEEEEGLPENARVIKAKVTSADALLIVSPEYNSSVTPLLKNLIDWISRSESDEEPALSAYRGKVVGLMSASPGQFGGMRGLVHLRSILGNIGVLVVPVQYSLSGAYDKFDEAGLLIEESARKGVVKVIRSVVETATKLKR